MQPQLHLRPSKSSPIQMLCSILLNPQVHWWINWDSTGSHSQMCISETGLFILQQSSLDRSSRQKQLLQISKTSPHNRKSAVTETWWSKQWNKIPDMSRHHRTWWSSGNSRWLRHLYPWRAQRKDNCTTQCGSRHALSSTQQHTFCHTSVQKSTENSFQPSVLHLEPTTSTRWPVQELLHLLHHPETT